MKAARLEAGTAWFADMGDLTATRSIAGVAREALTARDGDVLLLLIEGCTDREIAEHFGISRRTVSKHVEAILSKFGVHSRGAAVAEVLRHGWPQTAPQADRARAAAEPSRTHRNGR